MDNARKAGLVGGAFLGAMATGVAAQEELPTVEGIESLVASRIAEEGGISVGGSSGGTVASGGSTGGGIVTGGGSTGGGSGQIGSSEGLAIADASGGDNNVAFVS